MLLNFLQNKSDGQLFYHHVGAACNFLLLSLFLLGDHSDRNV